MFGTIYTYKIAFLPWPVIHITAFSEVPKSYVSKMSSNVLSEVLDILEKALNTYSAVLMANQPTAHTHNLNFEKAKNAVVVCCSIKFQSAVDMNNFIENVIKKQK